jgi:glycerol-3-phosphate dehydrogenase (NAD(P)+)
MSRRIGILGAGNMGSALAHLLAGNGAQVVVWEHFQSVREEIRARHTNSRFLPGVQLHEAIRVAESPGECVAGAEIVILAVPSLFAPDLLRQIAPYRLKGSLLLSAAKGIDAATQEPISRVLARLAAPGEFALLAGPAIANEFARGRPTAIVLAGEHGPALESATVAFRNAWFGVHLTTDLAGAALGGILKNIYAILLGYLEGTDFRGRNFQAAVLTASARELALLGTALGGRLETFHGLAGLGDLLATALSEHSHNRRLGQLLGGGLSLAEAEKQMGWLPEGARTVAIARAWASQVQVELPLLRLVENLMAGRLVAPEEWMGHLC